jgi:hypothetical protein
LAFWQTRIRDTGNAIETGNYRIVPYCGTGLNPSFEIDGNATLAGKETASGKETIYERVP